MLVCVCALAVRLHNKWLLDIADILGARSGRVEGGAIGRLNAKFVFTFKKTPCSHETQRSLASISVTILQRATCAQHTRKDKWQRGDVSHCGLIRMVVSF